MIVRPGRCAAARPRRSGLDLAAGDEDVGHRPRPTSASWPTSVPRTAAAAAAWRSKPLTVVTVGETRQQGAPSKATRTGSGPQRRAEEVGAEDAAVAGRRRVAEGRTADAGDGLRVGAGHRDGDVRHVDLEPPTRRWRRVTVTSAAGAEPPPSV